MRVIVAPDSYKGSVSATDAATAMESGVKAVFPDAQVVKIPLADGGEGTVEALVSATGGSLRQSAVAGPLPGQTVTAVWGVLGDGVTAVIEMAAASGLPLVREIGADPLRSGTYGTGELLKAALDAGFRKIIIGLGGSATNDGGLGLAVALGARFLDAAGQELPACAASLALVRTVDLSNLDPRLREAEVTAASDVDNPLCGPRGATAVFGPQKGVGAELALKLDQAMASYAAVVSEAIGRAVADTPGAGAAGGLGAGLLWFTKARICAGIDIIIEATGFAGQLQGASLLITGEGNTDFQTAFGKAPAGVARLAAAAGVPAVCLSGGLGQGYADLYGVGMDVVMGCPYKPMSLRECMDEGPDLIRGACERLCRALKTGMRMA